MEVQQPVYMLLTQLTASTSFWAAFTSLQNKGCVSSDVVSSAVRRMTTCSFHIVRSTHLRCLGYGKLRRRQHTAITNSTATSGSGGDGSVLIKVSGQSSEAALSLQEWDARYRFSKNVAVGTVCNVLAGNAILFKSRNY